MFRMKNVILHFKRKFSSQKLKTHSNSNVAFGKYLFLTNTATSGILMLTGDAIEQEIEYRQNKVAERFDDKRLYRMLTVGLAQGPLQHWFYLYLDKILPKKTVGSVLKKILLDQFIMSPVCIVSLFYIVGLMEHKSIQDCNIEIKKKFIDIYVIDWLVWPPTQYLNFYFFPLKYQVLFVNFTTAIYNIFLSYMKHHDQLPIKGTRRD